MGIGLTTAELTDMRVTVLDLMPDTCTIQSMSTTKNSIGEAVHSYSNRGTSIQCRLDPLKGHKEEYGMFGGVLQTEGNFVLTVPYDQTVTTTDRVIVDGTTFEVVFVDPEKSWNVSVRAVLKEIGT